MPVLDKPALQSHIADLATRFGTPTWVYDEATIEQRITEVKPFDVIRYAQKANSNLAILALMRRQGVVVDAVTAGEMHRAMRVGYRGDTQPAGIVYTADLFDDDALAMIREHRIPVNVGSPDMIDQLGQANINVPITLRINPGFGHGHSRKVNTGGESSKHGIWHTQIDDCKLAAQRWGLSIHGLHMHIGSGSDFEHLGEVCDAMVSAARAFGPGIDAISAGGGLPIPYHHDQPDRIDVAAYHRRWDKARQEISRIMGQPVTLEVEPGRYLVAESGLLVTRIRSIKQSGSIRHLLVDAGFNDLIRPSFYGSWHHISIVPADGRRIEKEGDFVVAGPLCESCDVFTQEEGGFVTPRRLPEPRVGDLLVLHDTGAYGMAMSSNYNSRRLAAEVMIRDNGEAQIIRERQTLDSLIQFESIPDDLR